MCCLYTLYIDRRKLGIETAAAWGCACFYSRYSKETWQKTVSTRMRKKKLTRCVRQRRIHECTREDSAISPASRGVPSPCFGSVCAVACFYIFLAFCHLRSLYYLFFFLKVVCMIDGMVHTK
ncbi:hypothetical protein HRI_005158400 [Hibiscus trionum]|uniref:Uncharacterized protein n=1 Tax=Hibiscus trionum TaxID=183268 RepID=A0A9W7MV79_HIBTR|nr:hypothetical protein HRI_005158400 [Hibiscus trionum]